MVEIIAKGMNSSNRLMVFLVAAVSFLVKNLTAFLIVEIFIDRYILIAYTDDIAT